jgi:2-hydroxy-6-oxonona-2,4-dienedioate hydrolase
VTLLELEQAPPAVEETTARVELDWGQMHARTWTARGGGNEPPFVLVHGLGVASRMCRPLGEHLAPWAPVHAPDLPGFGESDAPPGDPPDIPALADHLAGWMHAHGLARTTVVGTSLGAQVTAELAHRHPHLCGTAVLASPIVDASRRSWPQQILRWQLEQATQSLAMRALIASDYAKCGLPRVARTFARALEHRPEDTVVRLRQPVLVCWGTRDPLLSRSWVGELASLAPAGDLVVMPGVVHAMCHENPLETARVVTHFLDRLPIGV